MRNTKGQGDVISTVLIILLVVAAVAIIAAIILNVVNRGGTSVNASTACQAIDVHPTSCTVSGTTTKTTTAVAYRGAGTGSATDVKITSVTFIFGVSGSGNTQAIPVADSASSLTNVGGTLQTVQPTEYANVKTAATLQLSDGNTANCDASPVQVTCTS